MRKQRPHSKSKAEARLEQDLPSMQGRPVGWIPFVSVIGSLICNTEESCFWEAVKIDSLTTIRFSKTPEEDMGGKKRCSHPDSRNNKRNSKDNGDSKNTEGDQGTEEESVWVVTRRKQAFDLGAVAVCQLFLTRLPSASSLGQT